MTRKQHEERLQYKRDVEKKRREAEALKAKYLTCLVGSAWMVALLLACLI